MSAPHPSNGGVGTVVIKIATTMFLAEATIMAILPSLGDLTPTLDALIDATLLTLLSTPIIYFWVIRPFLRIRDEAILDALQAAHEREAEARQHSAEIQTAHAAMTLAKQQAEADLIEREEAQMQFNMQYVEMQVLNQRLKETQGQLMQSDKLASIGQLAAGVAHEINNPIGYVHSNLGTLENYLNDLFSLIVAYEAAEAALPADAPQRSTLAELKRRLDLPYLRQDIPQLMGESKEGISRVRKIIQDLKDFSRLDSSQDWQMVDLHQGIDSTLNIVHNEIKYHADVIKEYADLPEVECLPSQLNQVFMNLLVNAAHAMQDGPRGTITVRTGQAGEEVWVEVIDTGMGMPEEVRARIFDPFFTTKPVGKGTGLGLSLAYGIIKKHLGRIEVHSEVGHGTTFRVTLPIRHRAESLTEPA